MYMRSLLHYLMSMTKLLLKYSEQFVDAFSLFVKKMICVVRCIWKLFKDKSAKYVNHPSLDTIYPDIGRLSDEVGFKTEICTLDLSIIIPMYNASANIQECIESIIQQKTKYHYELILIDDGSFDQTEEIIQKYLTDQRIRHIKQDNAGQSVARNRGIYNSKGKYLMFVDSDDVLLSNAIELLLSTAEKTGSEIAEGSIVRFYNRITNEMLADSKRKSHVESNSNNPRFVYTTYGYCWGKVYKRDLWRTLRFPEGYIFEDIITRFILRRKAVQVAFLEDVVYGYRLHNNSSSHDNNHLKKLDSIWVLPKVFELCKQEKVPRDDVFYLLSLNHIGVLNCVTTRQHCQTIKIACFKEMQKQLLLIQDCKPKRMPLMFKLLNEAILKNKFDAWEYIAISINRYMMLKKWREIN